MSGLLCTGGKSKDKANKRSNMYSDSSSTETESEENFPGYIPIPLNNSSEQENSVWMEGAQAKAKMYQAYKGQMKISTYVNYGLLTVHVVMARHLKTKFKSDCDAFVKVGLLPEDANSVKCQTEVVHDTNSPLFDEKFSFELMDTDARKRLFISLWHRDHGHQFDFLGCMSFGIGHIQKKSVHGWYYLLSQDIGRSKHLQVSEKRHLAERGNKNIPTVNQDVMWMEPHVITIKRGKSGFGFKISGSSPVVVGKVDSGSKGEAAGLKPEDAIIRIDGLNVSRSTSESVARIIRHAQKKICLEVQRRRKIEAPAKVEQALKVANLERSPRQRRREPLSSTPQNVNPNWYPQPPKQSKETLIMSPWKPYRDHRRPLSGIPEEVRHSFSGSDTQDYGWVDGQGMGERGIEEEAIYMEPDEVLPQRVIDLPRESDYVSMKPPSLPYRPPSQQLHQYYHDFSGDDDEAHSMAPSQEELNDMVVSPWKPPSRDYGSIRGGMGPPQQQQQQQQQHLQHHHQQQQQHIQHQPQQQQSHYQRMDQRPPPSRCGLNAHGGNHYGNRPPRQTTTAPPAGPVTRVEVYDTETVSGSSDRYEWDYSDSRMEYTETNLDDYGWIDQDGVETGSGQGSTGTSGYSSSTLPRSMKLAGRGEHGEDPYRSQPHRGVPQQRGQWMDPEDGYHDDGYRGDQGIYYSSSGSTSAHSSSTLPRKKKVSFNVEFL